MHMMQENTHSNIYHTKGNRSKDNFSKNHILTQVYEIKHIQSIKDKKNKHVHILVINNSILTTLLLKTYLNLALYSKQNKNKFL